MIDQSSLRERYEQEGASVVRYGNQSSWDDRYHQRRFRAICATLEGLLGPDSSFTDVGCGTGEYVEWATTHTNGRVLGCDLAEEYCQRTRMIAPGADIRQADASDLPWDDRSVDVVMCSEVIEHIPTQDQSSVIQELARVTARHLVVTTPNSRSFVRRLGLLVSKEGVRKLDEEVGHISLLTENELRGMCSLPGFVVRAVRMQHTVPPVIGEKLHLPRATMKIATGFEAAADRLFPRGANQMILVASRLS